MERRKTAQWLVRPWIYQLRYPGTLCRRCESRRRVGGVIGLGPPGGTEDAEGADAKASVPAGSSGNQGVSNAQVVCLTHKYILSHGAQESD